MALSRLLKHIYYNASDEVIRRGKRIFHTGGVQLIHHDPITQSASLRVKNDTYYNQYTVRVNNYGFRKRLTTRCQCPYNMGPVCKHEAAALFQLNDLVESGFFENLELSFDQSNTTVRMRQITQQFLKMFSSESIFKEATRLMGEKEAIQIKSAEKDTVTATVKDKKGKKHDVILKQNEERYFDTSCTCNQDKFPLCLHKVALFLQLYEKGGPHYFSTIRDWDAQKNKLLALYGYSLEDDLKGKFQFTFHEGKLIMRVLNSSIKKLTEQERQAQVNKEEEERLSYGVVIERKGKYFPFTTFQLIAGEPDEDKQQLVKKLKRCDEKFYIDTSGMEFEEREMISSVQKLSSSEELSKHIKRNVPFGAFLDHLTDKLKEQHPEDELRKQAWDFYLPRYQNLLKQLNAYPFTYFLPEGKNFSKAHLMPVHFSSEHFRVTIKVSFNPSKKKVTLSRRFLYMEKELPQKSVEVINDGLIRYEDQIIASEGFEIVSLMEQFEGKKQLNLSWDDWLVFLNEQLLSISEYIDLDLPDSLKVVLEPSEPQLRLYLQETEKNMVLQPIYVYHGIERGWQDDRQVFWAEEGKVKVQKRDMAAEQTLLNVLRYLHPEMRESRKTGSFLLKANLALKGSWYFHFLEEMEKVGVEIMGHDRLKKLRISPFKPKTRLRISTGIDWFDAEMHLSYGEEEIPLGLIKKAFSKNQNFVQLKDGSVGLLPEEWIDKYSLLIKMGTIKGTDSLRLKKFHFMALENLEEDIDDEHLKAQLEERKAKLLAFDFGDPVTRQIPENVKAELRPYQVAGMQWMTFLKETGWGGILADDMGLGKTIQSLAFLQSYQNEHSKALFLVVCPTTLIYNWENEIQKFTPDIEYVIHHGSNRASDRDKLTQGIHLIITTYGTLRSDIQMLATINFDYVVLDESQAIKNPNSQVAKSALLLNSKNRLALSGTPVQNNTFDLFSQMNFLNPGLLGTKEFFRNQFSIPIDKMQEKESREHLKRLIKPFLLRRTKEQVASDLPSKTETILYCEMGQQQKKIYNAYRNSFRSHILGEIDEKGLGRTRFSVLTGLMKLRQICDSPAILKGEEENYENHSVKINELVRELSENTINHKALVFSQFLGMLALIREELDRLNIPYAYFDGSTSSKDREKAIQEFQKEDNLRVFLISLKAGGVGLNLTAADYVYIVDPWWNPTVEQQAIDRTHRIGQTKKIFAYRLICKDTIEEKILKLQERKLNLAKELIADENAFVKQLSREDIAYLLS